MKPFIFFDLDNTLIDHSHAEKLALIDLYDSYFSKISLNVEEFIQTYHAINLTYWDLYAKNQVTKDEVRYGRFKDLLLVIRQDHLSHDDIWSFYYSRYVYHWKLIELSIEILDYLLEKKYQLGIISNGFTDIQIEKINTFKLSAYFQSIILSESIGIQKPNPEIFLHACQSVRVLPTQTVMIGDSLSSDIVGALSVGMKAIFFHPNANEAPIVGGQKVKYIRALSELMGIFK